MSNRIAVFNQGRIEQVGTPAEIYEAPATEFVAGFVGTSNLLEGDAARSVLGQRRARSPCGRRRSGSSARTRRAPGPTTSSPPERSRDVQYLGRETRYRVELDDGRRAGRRRAEPRGDVADQPTGPRHRRCGSPSGRSTPSADLAASRLTSEHRVPTTGPTNRGTHEGTYGIAIGGARAWRSSLSSSPRAAATTARTAAMAAEHEQRRSRQSIGKGEGRSASSPGRDTPRTDRPTRRSTGSRRSSRRPAARRRSRRSARRTRRSSCSRPVSTTCTRRPATRRCAASPTATRRRSTLALLTNYEDLTPFLEGAAVEHGRRQSVYGDAARLGRQPAHVQQGRRRPRRRPTGGSSSTRTRRTRARSPAYDSPIYIADAALYLKNTQPDLGITDPYALDQEQFDAAVALMKEQKANVGEYWNDYLKEQEAFTKGSTVLGTTWQVITNLSRPTTRRRRSRRSCRRKARPRGRTTG